MDSIIQALKRSIPDEVRSLSRTLAKAGFRSWVVGGSVRDIASSALQDERPEVIGDWDLATDARPEDTQKLFRKVIPTGVKHGTVTVVLNRQHFEITTLRGEKGHSDGRRPDEVYFVNDLEEDLARRDFTVNAMAFDVESSEFFDPFSGLDDLKSGLIRAVGEPERRFEEDGLRVLRCARFCSTLKFEIEPKTASAIRPSLSSFEKVAQERVADEWFKALGGAAPSRFFRAIREHGMLDITAPELWSSKDTFLSFDETLARIDQASLSPMLRLGLFVRAGTRSETDPGSVARDFAARLRLSKDQTQTLARLCSFAELPPDVTQDASGYTARVFLGQVGRQDAPEMLRFIELARPTSTGSADLERGVARLRAELDSGAPLSLKELAVTGADLIAEAGIEKGPRLGQVLSGLLQATLRDPSLNRRDALLRLATEPTRR